MAGLADLDFEDITRTINLPNGASFTVRGIAMSDISRIVRTNTHDLGAFFERFMGEREQAMQSPDPKFASLGMATKFGKDLLTSAPALAADIIAHASDEPHLSHKVQRMPFPAQLEALEAIAELTFNGEEGIKKAGEVIVRMLRGATSLLADQNLSEIGTLDSEGNSAS